MFKISKSGLTDTWIHFFGIFLRQILSTKKNTAFGFLHQNRKTAQNLPSNLFSDWKPEIPLSMFSKLALTDMWIQFFEIFLRQKLSPKKNTSFGFLHQNQKTAQNLPSNLFSDWKPEIPLYMFSKSGLTDTWIHFFEIFLRQKVSARAGATFSKLHQKWKTRFNPSKYRVFRWNPENSRDFTFFSLFDWPTPLDFD